MPQPEVMQISYATRDIEATARQLAELEGVGPFFLMEFPQHDAFYRGSRLPDPIVRVAFGYKGDLQYELSFAPEGTPSIYGEMLDGRREAFHHTFQPFSDPFDVVAARYAAAGEPLAYQATASAARIRLGFVDARPRLGHFVELLETERMVGDEAYIYDIYAKIQAAAQGWSGQRPLRAIGELTG